jgi:LytS/YehU family sensor histidine kinase
VTVKEEMEFVKHYLYLQGMRFKENLHTDVQIDPRLFQQLVPPFAIQLLIENALKHNIVSSEHPLHISIRGNGSELRVTNNLQKKATVDESTGIGSQNIIDRYKTITDIAPSFREEDGHYHAVLPLIQPETTL